MCDKEEVSWKTEIIKYLEAGEVPVDKKEARNLRFKVAKFTLIKGELYKRGLSSPNLKFLGPYKDENS